MKRKGYPVADGYMGFLPDEGKYKLFETEGEYNEYFSDNYTEESEET